MIYGTLLNRSKGLSLQKTEMGKAGHFLVVSKFDDKSNIYFSFLVFPMCSLKSVGASQTTPTPGMMKARTTKIMGKGFTSSSPNWALQLIAEFHKAKQV